jgi:hypothetical protein
MIGVPPIVILTVIVDRRLGRGLRIRALDV